MFHEFDDIASIKRPRDCAIIENLIPERKIYSDL
jgi:hypothetical protein